MKISVSLLLCVLIHHGLSAPPPPPPLPPIGTHQHSQRYLPQADLSRVLPPPPLADDTRPSYKFSNQHHRDEPDSSARHDPHGSLNHAQQAQHQPAGPSQQNRSQNHPSHVGSRQLPPQGYHDPGPVQHPRSDPLTSHQQEQQHPGPSQQKSHIQYRKIVPKGRRIINSNQAQPAEEEHHVSPPGRYGCNNPDCSSKKFDDAQGFEEHLVKVHTSDIPNSKRGSNSTFFVFWLMIYESYSFMQALSTPTGKVNQMHSR